MPRYFNGARIWRYLHMTLCPMRKLAQQLVGNPKRLPAKLIFQDDGPKYFSPVDENRSYHRGSQWRFRQVARHDANSAVAPATTKTTPAMGAIGSVCWRSAVA